MSEKVIPKLHELKQFWKELKEAKKLVEVSSQAYEKNPESLELELISVISKKAYNEFACVYNEMCEDYISKNGSFPEDADLPKKVDLYEIGLYDLFIPSDVKKMISSYVDRYKFLMSLPTEKPIFFNPNPMQDFGMDPLVGFEEMLFSNKPEDLNPKGVRLSIKMPSNPVILAAKLREWRNIIDISDLGLFTEIFNGGSVKNHKILFDIVLDVYKKLCETDGIKIEDIEPYMMDVPLEEFIYDNDPFELEIVQSYVNTLFNSPVNNIFGIGDNPGDDDIM